MRPTSSKMPQGEAPDAVGPEATRDRASPTRTSGVRTPRDPRAGVGADRRPCHQLRRRADHRTRGRGFAATSPGPAHLGRPPSLDHQCQRASLSGRYPDAWAPTFDQPTCRSSEAPLQSRARCRRCQPASGAPTGSGQPSTLKALGRGHQPGLTRATVVTSSASRLNPGAGEICAAVPARPASVPPPRFGLVAPASEGLPTLSRAASSAALRCGRRPLDFRRSGALKAQAAGDPVGGNDWPTRSTAQGSPDCDKRREWPWLRYRPRRLFAPPQVASHISVTGHSAGQRGVPSPLRSVEGRLPARVASSTEGRFRVLRPHIRAGHRVTMGLVVNWGLLKSGRCTTAWSGAARTSRRQRGPGDGRTPSGSSRTCPVGEHRRAAARANFRASGTGWRRSADLTEGGHRGVCGKQQANGGQPTRLLPPLKHVVFSQATCQRRLTTRADRCRPYAGRCGALPSPAT